MRRFCNITLWGIAGFVLVLGGLSTLGVLIPLGDSLAVFRPVLAFLALAVAALAWARGGRGWPIWSGGAGLLGLGLGASVALSFVPDLGGGSGVHLTLYQKNMFYIAPTWEDLAADIRQIRPDVVTLQEVSARNAPLLEALKDLYPTQHYCVFDRVGGLAVLSRLPPTNAPRLCEAQDGLAAVQVLGPSGPIWLASLHLHWPWPYPQPVQAARLVPLFQGLEGPMILAGDFNMVPWSHRLGQMARATGTQRAGPARVSFWLEGLYPMPIDHVLGPKGGGLVQRPRFGSDHNGLLAQLPL